MSEERENSEEIVASAEADGGASHAALALAAFILAACGGGGGGGGGAQAPSGGSPPPPPQPVSDAEAARFLIQATFGATASDIAAVRAQGYAAWIDAQFATPRPDSHYAYVVRGGPLGCAVCDSRYINSAMETFWGQAVLGRDQLRQRMTFALSEIFVVSAVNSAIEVEEKAHAAYLDVLADHAFGNFRELLEAVARSPAMAHYLSHMRNEKEDLTTGRIPDENFAREVMQLFTIGLWRLESDGSRSVNSAGQFIPTYDQMDISGMAKVFTGLSWRGPDTDESRWHGWPTGGVDDVRTWNLPLQIYPSHHSTSEKRIINGVVIPAGTSGDNSLRIALDTLANHPNVGPFIGEQLIKRFVTSNPSRAYVRRVAQTFDNNGSGVRGDLRAVIRAILLDAEARDPANLARDDWGKLKEPMLRFSAWLRAFNASAQTGKFQIWNLEDPVHSLGQNPLRAPSVFNWFRPDYAPPGAVAGRNLVAPEFQITHDTTVTGYANFVVYTAERGHGYNESAILPDYGAEIALASQPDALIERLNLVLCANQLGADTRTLIRGAVEAIPVGDYRWENRRVSTAVALTMLAPEFLVQK